ncbi:hypothetical protein BKA93DRAFT_812063 [Sparassis latifolia]|uniref:L-azetidine-2-carboxylic acid acetyltransferase n=1 Tax=Sparassis crispa TaxID=139825 RepID=A0A401GG24_9APHY|nr:L-azetidine-2-carboxylic acid acetyltransferase [Sparassis crispa]GBE81053.1 L-azetidine-2-carboxylic acid acetyltransferase [Sparassis crispa]
MSAYGAILGPSRTVTLPSTLWHLRTTRTRSDVNHLTIHHLTVSTALALPGLLPYLHAVFADELDRGLSYPQEILAGEIYTEEMFKAYYFAGDVLIAVLGDGKEDSKAHDGGEISQGIEEARNGRSWEDCIAGCYYVKPNYPGRSSHICNAGFLVPPSQRGKGIGSVLARSFLYYAPRLGYEASVFNLVYVNNTASVRLWEALNFTKAGLIPRAGRLKKADGTPGEEYVDAYVYYRRFDKP